MLNFDGKIALVTGASGGIGSAIAILLHRRGATVVLHGTRREKLDALSTELGERAITIDADLSNLEIVDTLVERVCKTTGEPLSILVNNAGVTRDGLLIRMKNEEWENVVRINLTASMILSRAAIRGMMKSQFGRIISISSVVGTTGNAGQTNYSASKAGLVGFSKSLAMEVASRGITLNVVAPGFIETPMTDVLDERQKED